MTSGKSQATLSETQLPRLYEGTTMNLVCHQSVEMNSNHEFPLPSVTPG